MNQYITGTVIKELREKKKLTQVQLAERLNVSDKTISKWETGKGYPDISLLQPIAAVFEISVGELLSGAAITNNNGAANMLRSQFYVCPVCGNVIHSMGEVTLSCHGIQLAPEEVMQCNEGHHIHLEIIEDEYYIRIDHEMTKTHYISFIAAVSPSYLQVVKLYPEGAAETRLKMRGVKKIYCFCNQEGLFCFDIKRREKR